MRKLALGFVTLVAACLLVAGCQAQQPTVPVYVCPVTTSTNYTQVNLATPATGLTFNDIGVPVGEWCYIAQSQVNTQNPPAMSGASNIAGPIQISAGFTTALTWQAPTTGPTPTGYVVSRAPAISVPLTAPAITGATPASTAAAVAPDKSAPTNVQVHRVSMPTMAMQNNWWKNLPVRN